MSYNAMPWEVEFEDAFEPEFEELSEAVQDKAYAMFKVLSEFGPTLEQIPSKRNRLRRCICVKSIS